jgi:hypothetical protein
MGNAKNELENILNNTYGIEIEFGTHDNQMLSFTHIEVCSLFIFGTLKENGWKIETDADYTLELVSPILHFTSQLHARTFKDELMQFLEAEVRNGILLVSLMEELGRFIKERFAFPDNVWTHIEKGTEIKSDAVLEIGWITNEEMKNALTWENWDEDTDLERVLAARRILEKNVSDEADETIAAQMKQVLITKSRKHGGLPSSQLNLPLPLPAFTYYETHYKREKSWERLLEEKTSEDQYIAKKIKELTDAYPLLSKNEVWKAKYLHRDYIESKIDEKTSFWHRYWLWLETFYICAAYIAQNAGPLSKIEKYAEEIALLVDDANYYSTIEAKKKMRGLHLATNKIYNTISFATDTSAQLIYLIVYKVVAGALSEMSETRQKQAQEKIMALKGDMSMEQIMTSIPDNQFMQFHYALKDLTSLWFKAPLIDVLNAEQNVTEQQAALVKDAVVKIINLQEPLEHIISTVLHANSKLLGWYYSVCAANNQEFDYDWEEFRTYNMPSIPQFTGQLKHTCKQLQQYLSSPNPDYITAYKQLPQREVVFLQRKYVLKEVITYIAPWEGRWDTMKPVINPSTDKALPMYLVEHRNN